MKWTRPNYTHEVTLAPALGDEIEPRIQISRLTQATKLSAASHHVMPSLSPAEARGLVAALVKVLNSLEGSAK